MLQKRGFDTKRYLRFEKKELLNRAKRFDRLYLEFGGHLCYDGHASRVLLGYDPLAKLGLLKTLGDVEVIYCVNAKDINGKKRLGDFKLSYEEQTLKDINELKDTGIKVNSVVITRFSGEKCALSFKIQLENLRHRVYLSPEVTDYLKVATKAVEGYDKYPYIETNAKIVVITGAAGGSGKMSVAMSQIYKELKRGINAGYAKLETFPIWNLSINHPVNVAYEAATADLGDKLMIDPYYLKHNNKKAVNYNRDIENFAILTKIARIVTGQKVPFGYNSPTDMGVNMAKKGIVNDKVCRQAAIDEIKRRWGVYNKEFEAGRESERTIKRMREVMKKVIHL
jgi:uncharacterized protein (UPF0371 family)